MNNNLYLKKKKTNIEHIQLLTINKLVNCKLIYIKQNTLLHIDTCIFEFHLFPKKKNYHNSNTSFLCFS